MPPAPSTVNPMPAAPSLPSAAGLLATAALPSPVAQALADDPLWQEALAANPDLDPAVFDRLCRQLGPASWRARLIWHPLASGRLAELLADEDRRLPWAAALLAHPEEAAGLVCETGRFAGPSGVDLADLVVARTPTSPLLPTAVTWARPSTIVDHLETIEPLLDDATLAAVLLRVASSLTSFRLVTTPAFYWIAATRPAVVQVLLAAGCPPVYASVIAPVAVATGDLDVTCWLLRYLRRAKPGAVDHSTITAAVVVATAELVPVKYQEALAAKAARLHPRFPPTLRSNAPLTRSPASEVTDDAGVVTRLVDQIRHLSNEAGYFYNFHRHVAQLRSWALVGCAARTDPGSSTAAVLARWLATSSSVLPPRFRSRAHARLKARPEPVPSPTRPRRTQLLELTFGPPPAAWLESTLPQPTARTAPVLRVEAWTRPVVVDARRRGVQLDWGALTQARAAAAAVTPVLGEDPESWRILLNLLHDLGPSMEVTHAAGAALALL